MPLEPRRTVDHLKQLRDLTGDADGAQRVAWTPVWEAAREFLRGTLAGTGATEEIDAAGNQWFTLQGASDRVLVLGGHMDSVPNGGGLDGCPDVLGGGGGVRRRPGRRRPPGGGGPRPRGGRGGGRLREA